MDIGLLNVADIVRCARPLRSVFACVRETRAGPRASPRPPMAALPGSRLLVRRDHLVGLALQHDLATREPDDPVAE
jgi:hypothetical protein